MLLLNNNIDHFNAETDDIHAVTLKDYIRCQISSEKVFFHERFVKKDADKNGFRFNNIEAHTARLTS